MSKINSEKSEIFEAQINKPKHFRVVKLKQTLIEAGESSVIHGIPRIFKSKRIITQILWLVCFLVCIFACSYTIFSNISSYLSYDVVTKTQIIAETKSTFPTVTLCGITPLMTKFAENITEFYINKYNLFNFTNETLNDYLSQLVIANFLAQLQVNIPDYDDENRKQLGFNLNDSLMHCTYNQNACSTLDFEWYYDYNFGNCYKFNSGYDLFKKPATLKESIKPGVSNGLVLYLYVGSTVNKYSTAEGKGLKVFIHNKSVTPSLSEGIEVKLSEKTNIAIKRTFIKKYPSPYSSCTDLDQVKSKFSDLIKSSNRAYRQQDCFDLCLQKQVVEQCKCYDLGILKIDESKPCMSLNETICAKQQYTVFKNKGIDNECLAVCPLECNSIEYELTLSHSNFPLRIFYDSIRKYFDKQSFEDYEANTLALNIYYSSLGYIQISESPKTLIFDLFGSIGGLLGLFAGFSILSFVEMIEILIEVLFVLFYN